MQIALIGSESDPQILHVAETLIADKNDPCIINTN